MAELLEKIAALEDEVALRILGAIARAQRPIAGAPEPSADLAVALRDEFGVDDEASLPSDGQLARAALAFLAGDADYRGAIKARIDADRIERFAVGIDDIALTTAVLIVLTSAIEFKVGRDGAGRTSWSFRYTKPGLKEAAGSLVKKLVSLLPG